MTALEEFYEAYLHYSVSQRLFEDRCRQLTECTGTVAERQALVDETLRLAMCVTNNVIDLEPLLGEAADELRNSGGDRDILKALSLISNSIREDRDRADSYTLFVTARRSGNTVRRPRRPRVANPFEFVEEEEEGEEEVVAPAPARPKPRPAPVVAPEEPVEEEELVEEPESEDVIEEEEPEDETQKEKLVEENPVEEEETAPVIGPVPPAPNEGAEEDPVEEEETEEDEEEPAHSAALDRPRPKRKSKPRTEEPPEEDFIEDEDPDVPKRGLSSRVHNLVTALISHTRRK